MGSAGLDTVGSTGGGTGTCGLVGCLGGCPTFGSNGTGLETTGFLDGLTVGLTGLVLVIGLSLSPTTCGVGLGSSFLTAGFLILGVALRFAPLLPPLAKATLPP